MENGSGGMGVSNPGLLTLAQVARLLNAHPNSIRRWTNRGLLKCYRVGMRGDRRFRAEEVSRFVETGAGTRV